MSSEQNSFLSTKRPVGQLVENFLTNFLIEETFFGIYSSVAVFRRFYEELDELATNISMIYWGTNPFLELETIICDSYWIRSSIVFHPRSLIKKF